LQIVGVILAFTVLLIGVGLKVAFNSTVGGVAIGIGLIQTALSCYEFSIKEIRCSLSKTPQSHQVNICPADQAVTIFYAHLWYETFSAEICASVHHLGTRHGWKMISVINRMDIEL
jgi:hypothetical protein